ncbi:MAG: hypothetical protein DMF41_04305, partial [Verrucomicrobia bacterium]
LKEFVLGMSLSTRARGRGIIYYYGDLIDAAQWDLSLIPHGSTSRNSATPFLKIRKQMGKWLSQTFARASGYFSAVLPALRNQN